MISRSDPFSLPVGAAPAAIRLTVEDLRTHALISGVTGSGKTTTAKVIAESLSAQGVPIFAIDAKGDFSGVSQAADRAGVAPPVRLWDVQGRLGHRLRLQTLAWGGVPNAAAPWLPTHPGGAGYIDVLSAAALLKTPPAYAQVLLDLLNRLSHAAPPTAPLDRPARVVLIEEAHLLFRQLPPAGERALAATLRRLSAVGVAVVFIAPDPAGPPDAVDAVLGVHIQHALWSIAEPTHARLRQRLGAGDLREAVRSLGIGTVLVTAPSLGARRPHRLQVQRPETRDGPITPGERRRIIATTTPSDAPVQPRRRARDR